MTLERTHPGGPPMAMQGTEGCWQGLVPYSSWARMSWVAWEQGQSTLGSQDPEAGHEDPKLRAE